MSVYVDPALHRFGRMVMCHMWADSVDELLAMADRIGGARKWLQQPPKASWVHFDVCKSRRALAVGFGAMETDKYGPVVHTTRQRMVLCADDPAIVDRCRAHLSFIDKARAREMAVEGDE